MRAITPIALLALASGLLGGCRKTIPPPAPAPAAANTVAPGEFITTTGTKSYTANGGTSVLQVYEHAGQLHWELGFRNQNSSHSFPGGKIPRKSPGQAWFVYMEDSIRIWICNGSDFLQFSNGYSTAVVVRDGKLETSHTPPDEVCLRLPAEMQKLFPPVQALPKRPSI